eukprot:CAMPEP_0114614160 /NCGR_PEP_ID=MMETSP0168-20121206/5506_1 /TAXON_ID=95228 ORGANISM="Vannella sp., Strain DIVA3 517/6/12" /NCGR_SAMPLE_ID=MMETSP0168 /ASSEMBLY_ACC=CAM_ASM_000044 /LENGTH=129 /DNA_ID=CAMNT_0001825191 /DNA_START=47 /DNA_END=436 /DNA_ORIENTATION=+
MHALGAERALFPTSEGSERQESACSREARRGASTLKEWYGWHFPELLKLVTDDFLFARTVRALGARSLVVTDLTAFLSQEASDAVNEAAMISMGVDLAAEDLAAIMHLCDRVITLLEECQEEQSNSNEN